MLVLSRKINEEIIIDGQIRLRIIEVRGNQVRLGIVAPAEISIQREELVRAPEKRRSEASSLLPVSCGCNPT